MTPAVYGSLLGAVAFWGVVLGWELLEWRQYRLEARDAADVDRDRGSGRLVNLVTWTAIPGAFALAHLDVGRIPGNRWLVYGIGLGLLVAGVVFRQWAVQVLGRHFRRRVTIQAGHQVIRSGPYHVLRHPAYAGALVAVTGIGIAYGSWPALALCVLPTVAVLVYRIRVEEAALEHALGAAYRDYEGATARLLPGIW